MARFTSAWRTAGAGSTTLPFASLYSGATGRPRLVEVGIFNTTTTGFTARLGRLSTAGTPGSVIPSLSEDDPSQTAVATARDTHTVAPTVVSGSFRYATIPGIIGQGIIFTFGGGKTSGLTINEGTANGIGWVVGTGTGQVADVYYTWDE